MPALLIKDFLQTQGLKLGQDDVRVAYLTAQAVMNMGNASIERSILWHESEGFALAEHIAQTPENEALLKQIFMALDSVYSRGGNVKSAAVYAAMPSEQQPELVLLSRQGQPLAVRIDSTEATGRRHLPVRTAQSGWMNIADDVAYWLELGELEGEHDEGSQISVPVCLPSGAVLGVVHVVFQQKYQADEAALTDWTALALALSEPLATLLGVPAESEDGVAHE